MHHPSNQRRITPFESQNLALNYERRGMSERKFWRSLKKIIFFAVIVSILFLGWNFCLNFFEIRHTYFEKHKTVPADLIYDAVIPGMPDARLMIDPEKISFSGEPSYIADKGFFKPIKYDKPQVNMLALSGGGQDGAFGAGFLSGLTDSGKRPQYEIVTGVSTGALMAPAAFLGPSYDSVLKEIYTKVTDKDVFGNNIQDLLLGKRPSFFSLKPLRKVLKNVINEKLINEVADEHAKGRRLYVLTANIEARRVVIWDMGAIASYRSQRALELFRSVVIASSSIPAVFPPARFKVKAGGQTYEELHMDGSLGMQMFGAIPFIQEIKDAPTKGRMFIIRNGKLYDDPVRTRPILSEIAKASVAMQLTNQAYMDLIRMYALSKKSGIDFNCVFIPQDFRETSNGMFDPKYMTKLFNLGYSIAMSKEPWQKSPVSDVKE